MSNGKLWHSLSIDESYQELDSHFDGISEAQAEERLEKFGLNEIESGEKISKFKILIAQLNNPLVIVLIVAGIISLIAGKTADAVVIGIVIVLNSLIGYLQESKAEAALDALKAQAAPEADVIRQPVGETEYIEMTVPAAEIVPGDVIFLSAGSKVPADARLIEVANLEVEEAMLTGESLSVRKTVDPLAGELDVAERTNLVFGGTIITNGRGRAVVYATGKETQMGKIATLIQETEKAISPLQQQTVRLGKILGLYALGIGVVTMLLGWILQLGMQDIFMYALASAVSSIPEGLPAVMSIALAIGVNRMAKRNAIIRRLPAVDTLGAASVICTDKTGTLTTNQMTVQQIVTSEKVFRLTGSGFDPEGNFLLDDEEVDPTDHPDLDLALHIGALCNDSRLVKHKQPDGNRWEIFGDPTEGALIIAAAKTGHHKEYLEKEYHRVDELPFSSKTRFMATFHKGEDGKIFVFVKGAPETILQRCPQIQGNGQVRALSNEDRELIDEHNHRMAEEALRVLGLAYQIITPEEIEGFKEALEYEHEAELIFVGLAGMMDPPRDEVPHAVQLCQDAGIRVIMATGDHKITGKAIATEVGILREGDLVFTGHEVDDMSDDELDESLKKATVFARVAPEHKHRIVESLQRLGHVVGMTGDGVNDAPALQAAQIGIAMGITGTDVTKEVAEMVLADDNFASIVAAVEEGRVMFMNVRKVVKFLLATNIGENLTLLPALVLFAPDLIITPIQILFVNLVTDGILDITLAMEPKENDVMAEPPRKPDARIINKEIVQNIIFVGLFMAAGTLLMAYNSRQNGNLVYTQTKVFTTLAMFQVFNSLNCRSRDKSVFQLGFFKNPYLFIAIVASILFQIAAVYLPFMQRALGTAPLRLEDWGSIFLVSSTVFFADEIRKLVARKVKARKAV